MCISPSVPKYDPPVTLEAPLPEETPGVLSDPGDISTGKYRSKANRRGTQMFRTTNDLIGSSDPGIRRPDVGPGGTDPSRRPTTPVLSSDPGIRRPDVGPGGRPQDNIPGYNPKPVTNPTAKLGDDGGLKRPNRGGSTLEVKSTASTKKKNVAANPGLTINR